MSTRPAPRGTFPYVCNVPYVRFVALFDTASPRSCKNLDPPVRRRRQQPLAVALGAVVAYERDVDTNAKPRTAAVLRDAT
jgi:hypothetical protein